jgi:hypothetical protein
VAVLTAGAPAVGAQAGPALRASLDRGVTGVRYQYVAAGRVLADHLQHHQAIAGRITAGRRVVAGVRAAALTGAGFRSSWNGTGIGSAGRALPYLEQLAVVVSVPGAVAAELGGIAPVMADISEVTGFDNDGYLVGAQLAVRPRGLGPVDELVVTAGDLGDPAESAVTRRLRRFGRVSYGQLLVAGRLGAAAVTVEGSFRDGVAGGAGAVRYRHPSGRWGLRTEGFARDDGTLGAAVAGEIRAGRVWGEAGLASVDGRVLNGDRFGTGRRVFAGVTAKLAPSLEGFAFGTERIGGPPGFERRGDLGLRYDWRAALRGRPGGGP